MRGKNVTKSRYTYLTGPNYLSLMSHNQQILQSPSSIPQPVWLRGLEVGECCSLMKPSMEPTKSRTQ